jgi:hypothetical protein
MSTETRTTLHFPEIDRNRGWKDALLIGALAIVLGAFVAQISSAPGEASTAPPVATAPSSTAAHG